MATAKCMSVNYFVKCSCIKTTADRGFFNTKFLARNNFVQFKQKHEKQTKRLLARKVYRPLPFRNKSKDKTKQKSTKYTLNCHVLSGLALGNKLPKFDPP